MKRNKLEVFNQVNEKTLETSDESYINETLMKHLINKKLKQATYIKSIKYTNAYDHEVITIKHDNGFKSIYHIY